MTGPGLNTALVDSDAQVYGTESSKSDSPMHKQPHRLQRDAPRMVVEFEPACEGNDPNSATSLGTLCPEALTLCASTPDPYDIGYWVYTAPANQPADARDWQATGGLACRGPGTKGKAAPAAVPVVTVEDFRRLPIPAARLEVQPADGRTLINIPTNLYAGAKSVILPTTVLGQAVRVRATPTRFRWSYGDGTGRVTSDAGAPYPDLSTAHVYRTPGKPVLRLTTTYSGEYSVGGGGWLPIDGVATVASPAGALRVFSAQNQLVGAPVG